MDVGFMQDRSNEKVGDREGVVEDNPNRTSMENNQQRNMEGVNKSSETDTGIRSFRDTVSNKEPDYELKENMINVDDDIQAYGEWVDNAAVGRVVDFTALKDLRRFFNKINRSDVLIKYLGGFYVLVMFQDGEERSSFINDLEVWKNVFAKIEPWGCQELPYERIAWLKIHGVPLQLSCDLVMDLVGRQFGQVVQSASLSGEVSDFSFAYVGVLCNQSSELRTGEWIPDCLEDFDELFDVSIDQETSSSHVRLEEEDSDKGHDSDHIPMDRHTVGEDDINTERLVIGEMDSSSFFDNANPGNLGGNFNSGIMENNGHSNSGSKKGRRRVHKKRVHAIRAGSPPGQERPKKRARDEMDPFGLDRFI
ncbi:hypothetical protein Hdeb2414_s0006g00222141 [Helianthus debilis subsp. tardiflorus]